MLHAVMGTMLEVRATVNNKIGEGQSRRDRVRKGRSDKVRKGKSDVYC